MNIHHDPASRSRSKGKIAESELPLKTAGWMANGAEYRVSMPPGPGSLIGSACQASNRISCQFFRNWAIGIAGLEPTVSSTRDDAFREPRRRRHRGNSVEVEVGHLEGRGLTGP